MTDVLPLTLASPNEIVNTSTEDVNNISFEAINSDTFNAVLHQNEAENLADTNDEVELPTQHLLDTPAEDENDDISEGDEGMDDEDGDLVDELDSSTPLGRMKFDLPISQDGQVMQKRRASAFFASGTINLSGLAGLTNSTIANTNSTDKQPGDKRKAEKTGGASRARKQAKTGAAAQSKKAAVNSLRPSRSQSVYINNPKPGFGLLSKPAFGYGAAGTNSLANFASTTHHASSGKLATIKDLPPLLSARGSGNKENALDTLPPSGSQTSRVRQEVKSRFMVSNYSHATNISSVIEKAVPMTKPVSTKEKADKALTTTSTLTKTTPVNKRRSMEDMTSYTARSGPSVSAGKRRATLMSSSNGGQATDQPDMESTEEESALHPSKKAKRATVGGVMFSPAAATPKANEGAMEMDSEISSRTIDFTARDSSSSSSSHTIESLLQKIAEQEQLISQQQRLCTSQGVERLTLINELAKVNEKLSEANAKLSTSNQQDALLAEIASLHSRAASMQSDLSEARRTTFQAIEAESRLRPLGHENEALKDQLQKVNNLNQQLKAKIDADMKGHSALVSQNLLLHKEIASLKERIRELKKDGPNDGTGDEWTSGTNMKFATSATLTDGRRATAAPGTLFR